MIADPSLSIRRDWQEIIDLMVSVGGVAGAAIMEVSGPTMEVASTNDSPRNPYQRGTVTPLHGTHCQRVVETGTVVKVEGTKQASTDEDPVMQSYYGLPVRRPDGTTFGTICVYDRRPQSFDPTFRSLMERLRDMVELQLALQHAQTELSRRNADLEEALRTVQTLSGLLPICSHCKSIKSDEGEWSTLESYITSHSHAQLSHGICPSCAVEHYPDVFGSDEAVAASESP